jgi:hypothetical protein
MPRTNRHFVSGLVSHITHRCLEETGRPQRQLLVHPRLLFEELRTQFQLVNDAVCNCLYWFVRLSVVTGGASSKVRERRSK